MWPSQTRRQRARPARELAQRRLRVALHRPRELLRHAVAVGRLGDGLSGKIRCFAWYLLLPLKRRVAVLDRRIVVLRIRVGEDSRRLAFSDRSELIAFEEIFCDGEYALAPDTVPETIVDAGANVGASVLWFASRYPSARIIALEPGPTTARKLRMTLEGVARVEVVEAALAASSGTLHLAQAPRSWAARIVPAEHPGSTVAVRAISLPDLLAEHAVRRVGLLKLDVEGSEWDVLPQALALSDAIVVEVHGEDRVRRLNELAGRSPTARVTWANDRVALIELV